MGLDRRNFLQQSLLGLVSLGVSETGLNVLSENPRFAKWLKPYLETLAQTTNRKVALLVGINHYAEKNNLKGCLNDLELQKELLVNRFGFKTQDVHLLTNRQATRENIEAAFTEYLAGNSSAEDIVVFHFSGYGSQVKIPNATEKDDTKYQLVNSLVPFDGFIRTKGNPVPNYLLQDTLNYLGRSLNTENIITCLDTSFQTSKDNVHGNYRARSYSQVAERPNPEEIAFQEQLQRNLTGKGLVAYRKILAPTGLMITAAEQNQIALEGTWHDFSAGLLTYTLTRYLWQIMPSAITQVDFKRSLESVSNRTYKQQKPTLQGKLATGKLKTALNPQENSEPAYGGEAVITSVDSKGNVNLKLVGLPLSLLDSYHEESCFSLHESAIARWIQLKSRDGITAKAQFLESIGSVDRDTFVGKLVQEKIRVTPRQQILIVALDSHLVRIERVDATSALANLERVKAGYTIGESYADCSLSKISLMIDKQEDTAAFAPEKMAYSYGLQTPQGHLLPNTAGEPNEVVKLAVNRLQPYFAKLLAAKCLECTVNNSTSTIPVSANLELASKNSLITSRSACRGVKNEDLHQALASDIQAIPVGSTIRFTINNQGDRDLYAILVGIDSLERFTTFYPLSSDTSAGSSPVPKSLKIEAQSQLTIPKPATSTATNAWEWQINQPLGQNTLYLIFSTKPWSSSLEIMAKQYAEKSTKQSEIIKLANPLEFSEAILADLHDSSAVDPALLTTNPDVYAWDVNEWASFKFVYDVV